MPKPYQNPDEAQQGLTSAFSPSTPEQTTAIQNAASLVPGAPATPTPTTESPYYSRYTPGNDVVDTPVVKAKTENQIVSEKTAAAQGQIDAINKHYQNLLGEQKIINEGRDRSTSSVNTLSGLAGSTEANIQQGKTTELNQKDNQKIQEQQNLQIQNLFGQIRASAVQEAQQSRLEARQSSQDAIAARTARQTEAVGHLTNLAKSGVTMAGLKTTDPKSYEYLVKSLGGEEQVKAMFTLNRPQETILDKKIEGGKYIISYQNPLDGKIRIETLDLGLPPQYTKTIDAGDRILAMPDNWDGDPSKLITINKGLTPSAAASGSSSGDLNAKQTQNFLRISDKYQSDEIMKSYSRISVAGQIADQVLADPNNAANQLKSLYALVKNLDPDSAVREGELSLAQQTQSYLDRFKTSISRISSGQVLAPSAATELANATKDLVSVWEQTAQSRTTQYRSQANVAGIGGAFDDYLGGFDAVGSPQAETVRMSGPDGEYDVPADKVDIFQQNGYKTI